MNSRYGHVKLGWVGRQISPDGYDLILTPRSQGAPSVPAEKPVGSGDRNLQSFVPLSRTISGRFRSRSPEIESPAGL